MGLLKKQPHFTNTGNMRIAIIFILFFLTISLFADTLTVKQDNTGDFTRIQDAIEAAQTGDTVLIWPGTYYENIDFIGKSITVGSLMLTTNDDSYKYNTIIDGNHNGSCVLVMWNVENAVLYGLTLQHGSGFAFEGEPFTTGGAIFVYEYSNLNVINCLITDNFASASGGGITLNGSKVVLSGTDLIGNHAYLAGGGIAFGYNSSVEFDSSNRCNIYYNFASIGCDIMTSNHEEHLTVYLDTCTVQNPDRYFVLMMDQLQKPVDNISFDINHGLIQPWDGTIYVDPVNGNNSNTGANPYAPLQSIAWAYSKIAVSESHRNTIRLANGFYSDSASNQIFPLNIRPNIDVVGESKEGVIIDGEYKTFIARGDRTVSNFSFKNMTMQRGGYVNYDLGFQLNDTFIFCYLETENIDFENIVFKQGWISPASAAVKLNGSENVRVTNCDFIENFGEHALRIGLWNDDDTARVSHCRFIDNNVDYNHPEKRYGGGIRPSGGTIVVSNSLFLRNNREAVSSVFEANNHFVNCTFVDNSLEIPSVAIWCADSKVVLYNCIEYNNGEYPLQVVNVEQQNPSLLAIYYSLIQNGVESISIYNEEWSTLIYDESNIEGDPLFQGGDWQPYNLSENSPCIDAGTMDLPDFIEIPEYDLAGNPRVVNGKIDMGAFEWNPTVGNHEIFESNFNDSLVLSPNPASDYLHVKLYREKSQNLEKARGMLMDMNGNILDQIEMSRSDITYIISIGQLVNGTYLFIYDNGRGLIKSKKVIIRK